VKNILFPAIIAILLLFGIGGLVFAQTSADPITGYYVSINGQQAGPFDTAGLRQLISVGQLTETSLVWREGMANWAAAATVAELAPLFSSSVSSSSSAKAQDPGFSADAEYGVLSFQSEPIEDYMYLMPSVSYDGMISEALEFKATMGFPFWYKPEPWLGIDLDLALKYNSEPWSFILNNRLGIPVVKVYGNQTYSPIFGFIIDETNDTFIPKIRYTWGFNSGSLYFQANLPIRIMPDAFKYIAMHFGLGWKGDNGFGLNIWESNYLRPDAEFFQYIVFEASYEADSFYGEIGVGIPTYEDGIKYNGIEVTPAVEFRFANGFTAYAELPIWNIGSDYDDEVYYGLFIGVKKGFGNSGRIRSKISGSRDW